MSEKYRIIILPEAQQDIRETVLYIAREFFDLKAAIELQDLIAEKINSLSELPFRGAVYDEDPWKEKGVRWVMVKNYYIYYYVSDQDQVVRVLSVIYKRRDQRTQMLKRRIDNS